MRTAVRTLRVHIALQRTRAPTLRRSRACQLVPQGAAGVDNMRMHCRADEFIGQSEGQVEEQTLVLDFVQSGTDH